ncbi:MAG: hypothetical protein MI743_19265 [Sneathiellales bacterium]|nr:hypothetical protein [Sneathiellales bacterium]
MVSSKFKQIIAGSAFLVAMLPVSALAVDDIIRVLSVQGKIEVGNNGRAYTHLTSQNDLKVTPRITYKVDPEYYITAVHYQPEMAMENFRGPISIRWIGQHQPTFPDHPSEVVVTNPVTIVRTSYARAAIEKCEQLAQQNRARGKTNSWIFSRKHDVFLSLRFRATIFNNNPYERQIQRVMRGAYGIQVICGKTSTVMPLLTPKKDLKAKPVLTPSQRYNLKKKLPNLN